MLTENQVTMHAVGDRPM